MLDTIRKKINLFSKKIFPSLLNNPNHRLVLTIVGISLTILLACILFAPEQLTRNIAMWITATCAVTGVSFGYKKYMLDDETHNNKKAFLSFDYIISDGQTLRLKYSLSNRHDIDLYILGNDLKATGFTTMKTCCNKQNNQWVNSELQSDNIVNGSTQYSLPTIHPGESCEIYISGLPKGTAENLKAIKEIGYLKISFGTLHKETRIPFEIPNDDCITKSCDHTR